MCQLAKNYLLPDLRSFMACMTANSIGTQLDGSDSSTTGNALRNLASNTFNDWTVGLRFAMPLGFRFAHAQLRQSQLLLARTFFVLQDQELKAERFLGLYYRRMSSGYFQIKAARAQREAFATQLRVRYEMYRPAPTSRARRRDARICCWKRSASGPKPWPPSTRPSSPTTTPSPAGSTPRALSCSTTT